MAVTSAAVSWIQLCLKQHIYSESLRVLTGEGCSWGGGFSTGRRSCGVFTMLGVLRVPRSCAQTIKLLGLGCEPSLTDQHWGDYPV